MRIKSKIAAVALVGVLACSCSLYRGYTRAELPQLDSLFGADVCSTDTLTLADVSWRDFFGDACLQALIEQGLCNNADMQIAAARVLEAQSELEAARMAFLPSVSVKGSGALENAARYGGTAMSYSIAPAVSWEADIAGRMYNNREMARADADKAELYRRSVQTELIASIADCYYTLLMLDAQLEVSRTTAATWKENVRIMKAMKSAGMTNEASVAHTEANSCSIDASLFDLQYKIKQMENTLSLILGDTPRSFSRGTLGESIMSRDTLIGVSAQLLSRRPDVMMAEAEVRKAFHAVNAAKGAFYPSLTLSGDYGWEKALTSPAGWALGLAANAVAPVFNRGRNKAALNVAEQRQQEAFTAFKQTLLKAGSEVNTAIARCRAASSKKDVRIRQIASLESAVESTQQLMRHSESTYLEVLTAQQSLLSAQLQQVSDNYEALQGMISLYRALGGGAQ